jgi:hypothetical protein
VSTNSLLTKDLFAKELPNISRQSEVDVSILPKGKELSYLLSLTKNAYFNFIKTGSVLYGFILRSKNPDKTGKYSNIFIESSLMLRIRNLINETKLCKNKSIDYMIYKAFMFYDTKTVLLQLFPQYIDRYNHMEHILSEIIQKIYVLHKNQSKKPITEIDMLCVKLKDLLDQDRRFKFIFNNGRQIIKDFILANNNIEMMYEPIKKLIDT